MDDSKNQCLPDTKRLINQSKTKLQWSDLTVVQDPLGGSHIGYDIRD